MKDTNNTVLAFHDIFKGLRSSVMKRRNMGEKQRNSKNKTTRRTPTQANTIESTNAHSDTHELKKKRSELKTALAVIKTQKERIRSLSIISTWQQAAAQTSVLMQTRQKHQRRRSALVHGSSQVQLFKAGTHDRKHTRMASLREADKHMGILLKITGVNNLNLNENNNTNSSNANGDDDDDDAVDMEYLSSGDDDDVNSLKISSETELNVPLLVKKLYLFSPPSLPSSLALSLSIALSFNDMHQGIIANTHTQAYTHDHTFVQLPQAPGKVWLLTYIRKILTDRIVSEILSTVENQHLLPFPEFVYVWFESNARAQTHSDENPQNNQTNARQTETQRRIAYELRCAFCSGLLRYQTMPEVLLFGLFLQETYHMFVLSYCLHFMLNVRDGHELPSVHIHTVPEETKKDVVNENTSNKNNNNDEKKTTPAAKNDTNVQYAVGVSYKRVETVMRERGMLCDSVSEEERKAILTNIKKACMIDDKTVALWPMMQRILSVCVRVCVCIYVRICAYVYV